MKAMLELVRVRSAGFKGCFHGALLWLGVMRRVIVPAGQSSLDMLSAMRTPTVLAASMATEFEPDSTTRRVQPRESKRNSNSGLVFAGFSGAQAALQQTPRQSTAICGPSGITTATRSREPMPMPSRVAPMLLICAANAACDKGERSSAQIAAAPGWFAADLDRNSKRVRSVTGEIGWPDTWLRVRRDTLTGSIVGVIQFWDDTPEREIRSRNECAQSLRDQG